MKISITIYSVLFAFLAGTATASDSLSNDALFEDLGITWWSFKAPAEVEPNSYLSVVFRGYDESEDAFMSFGPVSSSEDFRIYYNMKEGSFLVKSLHGSSGGGTHFLKPQDSKSWTRIEESGHEIQENQLVVSISASDSKKEYCEFGYFLRIEKREANHEAHTTAVSAPH